MGFQDVRGNTSIPSSFLNANDDRVLPIGQKPQWDAPAVPAMFEPGEFMQRVVSRLRAQTKRGNLAYIELQDPYDGDRNGEGKTAYPSDGAVHADLCHQISMAIGQDDIFCWHGGRFILLFSHAATTGHTLRQLGRGIAKSVCNVQGAPIHLTPAMGYADLRMASTAEDLLSKAETALDCAKSSLEIEPFRYSRKVDFRVPRSLSAKFSGLWGKAPQLLVLSVQLVLSLVLGLGAPFILYAVCDALGVDISGPVYIGVVAVLVITATTIWIEGFLALKSTAPPQEPGSAYPLASIIIPAYLPNEAATIVDTLNAFLRLDYPNTVQVIIAYNSPKRLPVEEELEAIAAAQEVGGRFIIEPVCVAGSTSKAQNVNAVIGRVRGQFVGIFDADHHPRPESLQRAWRWLSNGWDIVQGRCSIRNGADSWVSRMVAVEFEQIYAVSHPGRARFHGFGIFGGSNGFWRTPVLHETRMRHAMLTEDIDSSIRAVEAGYKIAGDRDLVSEELAPTALNQLLNQRLRWAQGWFQVSLQRIIPVLSSSRVTFRQKLGLIHLLIWRELFPWYSIQVLPIMTYWVWAYGWHYIHWAVPIFVITTVYTISTGPGQILFAYLLAEKSMQRRPGWFLEYLLVSTFFFSPFKDALSRIAHIKEAMRERAWRVTPRTAPARFSTGQLAKAALVILLLLLLSVGKSMAQTMESDGNSGFSSQYIRALLGGEVATINAARRAAAEGHSAEAAKLFEQAISAVPSRRGELLREYADALSYADRAADAVPLYREMLASADLPIGKRADLTAHLALALTWSGQYRAALDIYDEILMQAPEDADAAVHRARVLAWLGHQDAAVATLDKVAPQKWASGTLGMLGDEILIDAAREAARTNRNAISAQLFDRALHHNAGLRSSILREYADQLVYSDRAAAAIPLYHEVIDGRALSSANRIAAQMGLSQALMQSGRAKDAAKIYALVLSQEAPGTKAYKDAQRGLALALTWSNAPAKALYAWGMYLKVAPGDNDAVLHQAQLLSTLHQDAEALQAYKAAYAADPQNADAKHGIVDETISLARAAARNNKNEVSAELFARAIDLDSRTRMGLLREYADQLTFNGRPAEAIPLYREAFADESALSPLDRKRAMAGLADAYAWAHRPDEALAAYTELTTEFPDDLKLQWTKLVFEARQAAQINQNNESAALFAQAIAITSVPDTDILKEYADQLSFSGHADRAISFYKQALAGSSLVETDRVSAQLGLAQAYDWSGQQDEAKSIYDELIAKNPGDATLKWSSLVVSAHKAAREDKNKEAADLFEQAIRLVPARRSFILREYADQLSFTGRAALAIPLYREVLNQSALSNADRLNTQKSLAQAYDWSGRQGEAKSIYNELIAKNPDDPLLRWSLLVVSAHQAAKEDRNKEAANFLAAAMHLVPGRRLLILKEYADKLTFSGSAKDAIPLYRELIAQGGSAADVRRSTLGLALALAWDSQLAESLDQYQHLVVDSPDDIDAQNGMARVLSWSGRQSDAEIVYQQVLARNPNSPEAQRGLAQAEDWQGHHRAAQALLTQRLHDDPNDLEALRLLAQSQVWMGRPDKAMVELNTVLKQEQLSSDASVPQGSNPLPLPAKNELSTSEERGKLPTGLRSANSTPESRS